MSKSRITIESEEANALSFFLDLRRLSSQIVDLQSQSEQNERLLRRVLERQERFMADLQQEFTAFNEALTRQLEEINQQIQQVADAVAAGQDAATVVEDARGKIVAATAAIQASADALAADDPANP